MIQYRLRNQYNGLYTDWQTITEDQMILVKEMYPETSSFRIFVDLDKVESAIQELRQKLTDCNRLNYCSDALANLVNEVEALRQQ